MTDKTDKTELPGLRERLHNLLADDDLTADKLYEAAEGLLPRLYDALLASENIVTAEALPALATRAPAAPAVAQVDIDAAVSRFLGWRLPDDFAPDNGISYTPIQRQPGWTHDMHPTGTNLLNAAQARAMLLHVLAVERAAVAEGWVLVPREPTPEMLDAMAKDCGGCTFGYHDRETGQYETDREKAASIYAAMLAAAPAPAEPKPAEDVYDTMYSAQYFLFLDPNGEGDESNTVPLTLGATFRDKDGPLKVYYNADRVLMTKPAEPVVDEAMVERAMRSYDNVLKNDGVFTGESQSDLPAMHAALTAALRGEGVSND